MIVEHYATKISLQGLYMRNKKANIKLDGESKPIIIAEKPMIFKNPKCIEKIPQTLMYSSCSVSNFDCFLIPNLQFFYNVPNNFYRKLHSIKSASISIEINFSQS